MLECIYALHYVVHNALHSAVQYIMLWFLLTLHSAVHDALHTAVHHTFCDTCLLGSGHVRLCSLLWVFNSLLNWTFFVNNVTTCYRFHYLICHSKDHSIVHCKIISIHSCKFPKPVNHPSAKKIPQYRLS